MADAPTPQSPDPQHKVLIVEDDIFLADLICRKFREKFVVFHAGSVPLARGILAKEHVDLICLDLQLPEENGMNLLLEVRKNEATKRTPVIIISNFSQDEDKRKARDAGANEYIVKANVDLGEIVKKGEELIAQAIAG